VLADKHVVNYLFEIIREAELVERLYLRFERAADAWLAVKHTVEPTGAVLRTGIESEQEMEEAIEGILSGFARISLFLFPSPSAGPLGSERGERLRQVLAVAADHPLANRELRNHWMHLDERFDQRLLECGAPPVGYYLQLRRRLTPAQRTAILRLIDPGEKRVYVLGKAYSLESIASAVEHVHAQAVVALIARQETAV
jgi:hypothetical protein